MNSVNKSMKKDNELITNLKKLYRPPRGINRVQPLQDKIGATAQQIRQAIEILGFDREKVEQYLLGGSR
jgi:hypothetical protein